MRLIWEKKSWGIFIVTKLLWSSVFYIIAIMDFSELILSKTFNKSKQLSAAEHCDHDTSDLHPGIFQILN